MRLGCAGSFGGSGAGSFALSGGPDTGVPAPGLTDFAPGFGVFLGGTRLEADLFAPGVISARIPELPAGLYPVRVVNPPVCATLAPLEIEVMPGPSPCGAGGSGAAWLAPAIVLGARARRRRARMLRSA